jgi:hypothetical protein
MFDRLVNAATCTLVLEASPLLLLLVRSTTNHLEQTHESTAPFGLLCTAVSTSLVLYAALYPVCTVKCADRYTEDEVPDSQQKCTG